jgi:hypothetical protein
MRPRNVSVLACAVLVLALPAAALARVGVSGTAKTPIVHVALGKQVPRQCAAVYRSTVNRSWASAEFHPQRGWASRCEKFGSNGVAILHHTKGRWHMVTAGSDFTCPIRHVPAAVAQDLRISCH